MNPVEIYKKSFVSYLNEQVQIKEPSNLYEPILYILQQPGKRLRPILTLMTCDIFDGAIEKAFDAALAIEVFHNFTLVHDDIMDNASIRRSQPTVFKKWGLNAGVLSGDAMMIMAYRCFEGYDADLLKELIQLFGQTALEVCEGQQMDIDFETKSDVTIASYMQMIKFKTSVLVAAAMKMGAMVANATVEDTAKIYEFGLNLGIAFQLQDDYLDTFGTTEKFGKKIGGDIIENKKTFLFLKCLEICDANEKEQLLKWFDSDGQMSDKVFEVTRIFENNNIPAILSREIEDYTKKALDILNTMGIHGEKKDLLKDFGLNLMGRDI
jgi:geranylgeranyl diphosphate synthase type II